MQQTSSLSATQREAYAALSELMESVLYCELQPSATARRKLIRLRELLTHQLYTCPDVHYEYLQQIWDDALVAAQHALRRDDPQLAEVHNVSWQQVFDTQYE